MIIALAGRRIDAADAKTSRFPLAMRDAVRKRLVKLFENEKATALVSSAACGADLLALDAAGELGIERHIILPFAMERFRETSVVDRPDGDEWGKLFDRINKEVNDRGNLHILEGFEGNEEEGYSAVTLEILTHAEQLASSTGKVVAIAVWDGKAKNESDETARFLERAKKKDIKGKEILTTF